MVQGTRPFLKEPEKDEEIQPLGKHTVTQETTGLDEPTVETIDIPQVQDCIGKLQREQVLLLGVALKHALQSSWHNGGVEFFKRTHASKWPPNWGLEVIDKGQTQGSEVFPLYVIFVQPQP